VKQVLESAPCDVAMFVARAEAPAGSFVLVPFGGGEHDWAAIELGAWIAAVEKRGLTIVGSTDDAGGRDASRQFASASLAIQSALGVAAEPLLVPPGSEGILAAACGAALIVAGLSDRWRRSGLGEVRHALATQARPQRCSCAVACDPAVSPRARASPGSTGRFGRLQPDMPTAELPRLQRDRLDLCNAKLYRRPSEAATCRSVLTCPSGASFSATGSRRWSAVAGWASSTWRRTCG
jgi:hypothetical protein